MTKLRALVIPCLVLCALFAPAPSQVDAASSIVDCGQISGYTAPDPIAPATGSLALGMVTPWTVAADATVSLAIETTLPSLVGSAPSCFALDLDDLGVITAIDFASEGTISGAVDFEAGLPGYVFDDRLLVPTFITDAYPGLGAVFATSADAGTNATATFSVDTTTGQLTGIDSSAAFCGPGDLDGDGNGLVGDATIPAAVLDGAATAALAGANLRQTCADVHTFGTINQGDIVLESDITIDVSGPAPTPPDTTTLLASPAGEPVHWPLGDLLALLGSLALGTLVVGRRHRAAP